MWRVLIVFVITCVMETTSVEAAKRKRDPPLDIFRACDLEVRENLREGGTWLAPNDIQVDEAA